MYHSAASDGSLGSDPEVTLAADGGWVGPAACFGGDGDFGEHYGYGGFFHFGAGEFRTPGDEYKGSAASWGTLERRFDLTDPHQRSFTRVEFESYYGDGADEAWLASPIDWTAVMGHRAAQWAAHGMAQDNPPCAPPQQQQQQQQQHLGGRSGKRMAQTGTADLGNLVDELFKIPGLTDDEKADLCCWLGDWRLDQVLCARYARPDQKALALRRMLKAARAGESSSGSASESASLGARSSGGAAAEGGGDERKTRAEASAWPTLQEARRL
eukprot:TRINITY_DN6636_c0_g1_i1.p1 TRINITY_DN6636_c0_g1~~TRINITY_DN6636_c0_g1_i1.p1  ORF type:complete len:307 (+),score=107.76 TRINITY_DN6636_c0_g1_i1:112-921(+)